MSANRDKNTEPEIRIIRPGKYQQMENDSTLRVVERISHLLDSQFIIPGTNIRFGIDPIMSLIPVLGDFLTYMVSAALIYTMHNHGASRKVVVKMILNSTLDAVVGAIPLVGTIFDVFYRSNDKNLRLLKEHYFEGKHHGSGNGIIIVISILCFAIVVLAFYGMYKLLQAIF
jgi:hypothetical protein